jgi:hypothetical protein
VNDRIGFVDPTTGANTNIIESYWRHLKVYVDPYSRKKGYVYDLAQSCSLQGARQATSTHSQCSCTSPRPLIGAVRPLLPQPSSATSSATGTCACILILLLIQVPAKPPITSGTRMSCFTRRFWWGRTISATGGSVQHRYPHS